MARLGRLRARIDALFPERHLYIRQGGRMCAVVLTRKRQLTAAAGLAAAGLWMGVCTAAMLINLAEDATGGARARAAAPAVARNNQAGPSALALAAAVERRHAELALLLADAKGVPGAAQALTPPIAQALASAAGAADPVGRLKAVEAGQDQVLQAADAFARRRAERLRTALRVAGMPSAAGGRRPASAGLELTAAETPQALAGAPLDLDPDFALQVRRATEDLSEAQALGDRAGRLPLARPTREAAETSGYGMRTDPFTQRSAFHPGIDFAGARMTPVYATAPGVVAFTGVRTGYGQTVEIDHGGGVRTRYAHLARIAVRPGEHVAAGAQLGGMGSTGRSTGTHLHYEVWVNGRAQNPERFVRAGAYVVQAGRGAG
jgi:murein DD-endopeptidase MepM/ murein hydrolase activator NlpD